MGIMALVWYWVFKRKAYFRLYFRLLFALFAGGMLLQGLLSLTRVSQSHMGSMADPSLQYSIAWRSGVSLQVAKLPSGV